MKKESLIKGNEILIEVMMNNSFESILVSKKDQETFYNAIRNHRNQTQILRVVPRIGWKA